MKKELQLQATNLHKQQNNKYYAFSFHNEQKVKQANQLMGKQF